MDGGGHSQLRAITAGDFAPVGRQPDTGPAPQLQWLRIADLVVDDRYQRPIYGAGRTNVRRIAEGFRWSMFAPVIVAPIVGGQFAIIDGQHRTTAAALLGFEQVPCLVIIADLQEQAAAFKAVNGQVTRMHNLALQAAALAAGDAGARALQDVADAAGVTILRYPKMLSSMLPGETMALGAIADSLKAHGRDPVVAGLRCVTGSKNNKAGLLSGPMIKGVCAAVAGQAGWKDVGEWLNRAFDRIDLAHELEEAQVTRRAKGVAVWEVLADRLRPRLADELAKLGLRPSISMADGDEVQDVRAEDEAGREPEPPLDARPSPAPKDSRSLAQRFNEEGPAPVFTPARGQGTASGPTVPRALPASPAPTPAGNLRAAILRTLKDGSCSAQGLATLLDAKEMAVVNMLGQLEHEDLVLGDRSAGTNSRAVRWLLPVKADA